ncbi:hypothetical protein ACN2XU_16255 [Primorskyibacter sp. 2E107]
MKKPNRFIKSIVATARQEHPPMPWHRGAPRQAMIDRRMPAKPALKSA